MVANPKHEHTTQVDSGDSRRGGWAGRARQNGTPTNLFAKGATVSRASDDIEDNCHEQLSGGRDEGNSM